MESGVVFKALRRYFDKEPNRYILLNSFVFNWESDFFFKTGSDYFVEIEVKVSKSDFKADFKKEKHQHMDAKFNGRDKVVIPGPTMEEITCQNVRLKYSLELGDYERVVSEQVQKHIVSEGSAPSHYNILERVPKYSNVYIKGVSRVPNRFYFACPEGLIHPDQTPHYAGLFYVTEDGRLVKVKEAPFIHKEKMDLTKVLLDKFYWLSKKCN